MNKIKLELNQVTGPMLINVEDQKIIIKTLNEKLAVDYIGQDEPKDIMTIFKERKGNSKMNFTSDIFDCFNVGFKSNKITTPDMKSIFKEILENSIQFIAKVSLESNTAILIQNSFNEENQHFLSTIGLIDDARITLAEITKRK